MNHQVFVYGTIKQGYQNHHVIIDSEFIASGRTIEKYAMYQKDYPFVVKKEAVSFIYGEVYSVDDTILALLDHLERHPGWYCREKVDVVLDDDARIIPVWLYFNDTPEGTLVKSGEFRI
jgi:gamma-glutamylaminecyclotransferase